MWIERRVKHLQLKLNDITITMITHYFAPSSYGNSMTSEGTSVITFNVHPQTNYQTLSIMPGNFLFCSDVRFVAGYMLLYDDQGVSLVYGTLSRVAGFSIDGTL